MSTLTIKRCGFRQHSMLPSEDRKSMKHIYKMLMSNQRLKPAELLLAYDFFNIPVSDKAREILLAGCEWVNGCEYKGCSEGFSEAVSEPPVYYRRLLTAWGMSREEIKQITNAVYA